MSSESTSLSLSTFSDSQKSDSQLEEHDHHGAIAVTTNNASNNAKHDPQDQEPQEAAAHSQHASPASNQHILEQIKQMDIDINMDLDVDMDMDNMDVNLDLDVNSDHIQQTDVNTSPKINQTIANNLHHHNNHDSNSDNGNDGGDRNGNNKGNNNKNDKKNESINSPTRQISDGSNKISNEAHTKTAINHQTANANLPESQKLLPEHTNVNRSHVASEMRVYQINDNINTNAIDEENTSLNDDTNANDNPNDKTIGAPKDTNVSEDKNSTNITIAFKTEETTPRQLQNLNDEQGNQNESITSNDSPISEITGTHPDENENVDIMEGANLDALLSQHESFSQLQPEYQPFPEDNNDDSNNATNESKKPENVHNNEIESHLKSLATDADLSHDIENINLDDLQDIDIDISSINVLDMDMSDIQMQTQMHIGTGEFNPQTGEISRHSVDLTSHMIQTNASHNHSMNLRDDVEAIAYATDCFNNSAQGARTHQENTDNANNGDNNNYPKRSNQTESLQLKTMKLPTVSEENTVNSQVTSPISTHTCTFNSPNNSNAAITAGKKTLFDTPSPNDQNTLPKAEHSYANSLENVRNLEDNNFDTYNEKYNPDCSSPTENRIGNNNNNDSTGVSQSPITGLTQDTDNNLEKTNESVVTAKDTDVNEDQFKAKSNDETIKSTSLGGKSNDSTNQGLGENNLSSSVLIPKTSAPAARTIPALSHSNATPASTPKLVRSSKVIISNVNSLDKHSELPVSKGSDELSCVSAYARLDFESFTFYVQTLQVVLGRRAENGSSSVDVHLGPAKAISRKHAKIFYNFGSQRFELSVLGRNGAFVDDVFVETGSTVALKDGTKIQIGQIPFTFILPSLNDNSDTNLQTVPSSAMNKPAGEAISNSINLPYHKTGMTTVVDDSNKSSKEAGDRDEVTKKGPIATPVTRLDNNNEKEKTSLVATNFDSNKDSNMDNGKQHSQPQKVLKKQQADTNQVNDIASNLIPLEKRLDSVRGEVNKPASKHTFSAPSTDISASSTKPESVSVTRQSFASTELTPVNISETLDITGPTAYAVVANNPANAAGIDAETAKVIAGAESMLDSYNFDAINPEMFGISEDALAALAAAEPNRDGSSLGSAFESALGGAGSNHDNKPKLPAQPKGKTQRREYLPEEIPEEYREKPQFSYSHLIATALRTYASPRGMSLSEIYRAIQDIFPYYKYCPHGWQNSVRHNLSSNKAFMKISKEGKGWLWGIDEVYCAQKELQKKKAAALSKAKAQAKSNTIGGISNGVPVNNVVGNDLHSGVQSSLNINNGHNNIANHGIMGNDNVIANNMINNSGCQNIGSTSSNPNNNNDSGNNRNNKHLGNNLNNSNTNSNNSKDNHSSNDNNVINGSNSNNNNSNYNINYNTNYGANSSVIDTTTVDNTSNNTAGGLLGQSYHNNSVPSGSGGSNQAEMLTASMSFLNQSSNNASSQKMLMGNSMTSSKAPANNTDSGNEPNPTPIKKEREKTIAELAREIEIHNRGSEHARLYNPNYTLIGNNLSNANNGTGISTSNFGMSTYALMDANVKTEGQASGNSSPIISQLSINTNITSTSSNTSSAASPASSNTSGAYTSVRIPPRAQALNRPRTSGTTVTPSPNSIQAQLAANLEQRRAAAAASAGAGGNNFNTTFGSQGASNMSSLATSTNFSTSVDNSNSNPYISSPSYALNKAVIPDMNSVSANMGVSGKNILSYASLEKLPKQSTFINQTPQGYSTNNVSNTSTGSSNMPKFGGSPQSYGSSAASAIEVSPVQSYASNRKQGMDITHQTGTPTLQQQTSIPQMRVQPQKVPFNKSTASRSSSLTPPASTGKPSNLPLYANNSSTPARTQPSISASNRSNSPMISSNVTSAALADKNSSTVPSDNLPQNFIPNSSNPKSEVQKSSSQTKFDSGTSNSNSLGSNLPSGSSSMSSSNAINNLNLPKDTLRTLSLLQQKIQAQIQSQLGANAPSAQVLTNVLALTIAQATKNNPNGGLQSLLNGNNPKQLAQILNSAISTMTAKLSGKTGPSTLSSQKPVTSSVNAPLSSNKDSPVVSSNTGISNGKGNVSVAYTAPYKNRSSNTSPSQLAGQSVFRATPAPPSISYSRPQHSSSSSSTSVPLPIKDPHAFTTTPGVNHKLSTISLAAAASAKPLPTTSSNVSAASRTLPLRQTSLTSTMPYSTTTTIASTPMTQPSSHSGTPVGPILNGSPIASPKVWVSASPGTDSQSNTPTVTTPNTPRLYNNASGSNSLARAPSRDNSRSSTPAPAPASTRTTASPRPTDTKPVSYNNDNLSATSKSAYDMSSPSTTIAQVLAQASKIQNPSPAVKAALRQLQAHADKYGGDIPISALGKATTTPSQTSNSRTTTNRPSTPDLSVSNSAKSNNTGSFASASHVSSSTPITTASSAPIPIVTIPQTSMHLNALSAPIPTVPGHTAPIPVPVSTKPSIISTKALHSGAPHVPSAPIPAPPSLAATLPSPFRLMSSMGSESHFTPKNAPKQQDTVTDKFESKIESSTINSLIGTKRKATYSEDVVPEEGSHKTVKLSE